MSTPEERLQHFIASLSDAERRDSDPMTADVLAVLEELKATRDLLADCVIKATGYGDQDGGFVASYILPTGPIHRAIPFLDERGINVRPGFDGRPTAKARALPSIRRGGAT